MAKMRPPSPTTSYDDSSPLEGPTTLLLDGIRRCSGCSFRPAPAKAVKALDRYLRVRVQHSHAEEPWLWLGHRGPVPRSGIAQILRKIGADAGVEHVHAHRFRHSFASSWLSGGGEETALMRLAGWKSRAMVSRYGASVADERARAAHADNAPGEAL